jgi:RNA polymerase sigma factor (sigma-70 family)
VEHRCPSSLGTLAMEATDADLVRACTRGDREAWETLVRRYERLVFSVARRSGLDEDAAADVFQRVFVSLIEHMNTLQQPDRLSAWLVTSAKRETWRASRRAAAQRAVQAPEEHAADVPDTAAAAVDEMVRLEEQDLMRRAVDSLDGRCRELLQLMFYSEQTLTYGEIAARLGIAEGSVGPIRGRCLERLRNQLAILRQQPLTSR